MTPLQSILLSVRWRFPKMVQLVPMAVLWSYRLTDKAKKELLSELDIPTSKSEAEAARSLIQCSALQPRELFYDKELEKQVVELTTLLGIEKFDAVCGKLVDKGMSKGFTCLFYGSPGTGKTETVKQIAIKTGRDLMPVNATDIMDKYVGESEKNARLVFEVYRKYAKKLDRIPILLFNEADAVISRRVRVDKSLDKMENSVQNIILEEMENFEGIMIATTNQILNIDPAFDRRFLYKIDFKKPSIETQKAIWKTMIPELTDGQLVTLASEYSFSGGQIENVARKMTVREVIQDRDSLQFDELVDLCEKELPLKRSGEAKKVGFK
jgi:SpoVK/Ycf46/Vps4 family AAA+-type ATPase